MAFAGEKGSIFEDAYSSVKELITERFSSPFIFSFIASWMLINYKVIILVLTDSSEHLKVVDKISTIENTLNSSYVIIPSLNISILLNAFLWPLLAAIFYTFIYPFIDYLITEITIEHKVKLRNMRIQKEEKTFYKYEDVQKIFLKHAEDGNSWRQRIERAELTEAELNAVINDLKNKLAETVVTDEVKTKLKEKDNDTNTREILDTQDEVETKFDLAKAYIKMGDMTGAGELLNEILLVADTNQRRRVKRLNEKIEREKISTDKVPPASKQTSKSSQKIELTQDEKDMLKTLIEANDRFIDWYPEPDLLRLKTKKVTDSKIALGDLVSRGFIKKDYRAGINQHAYQLTIAGMKAAKEIT